MALITNSKPIKSIPPERLVNLWDLFTGKVQPMSIERYNRLRGSQSPATAAYSEFNQRFYNLLDYPGQKIEMYHLKKGHLIDEMTLPLFTEIQKRNPVINTPVIQNGVRISDVYEPWKNYLATPQELNQAAAAPTNSIDDLIEKKVQEALAKKATKEVEPVNLEQAEPTKPEAPKPGRRKKSIDNENTNA